VDGRQRSKVPLRIGARSVEVRLRLQRDILIGLYRHTHHFEVPAFCPETGQGRNDKRK
jgi:hypothetical protein